MTNSILELIGNTPLVRLTKTISVEGLCANLLVKLESFNPGGSAKDRIALNMIEDAEGKGLLKAGATIIEPTSGNTGVGLALVCAVKGYHLILTMPETMSIERRRLVAAYGAEVVLTPGTEGMSGAIAKANSLRDSIPGSIILQQFENNANPEAHYKTTGLEIWKETYGCVDIFVAGIGTGGSISGIGKYLKQQKPSVKVIGIEPASSAVITTGVAGSHGLMGIGAGFIPKTLNLDVVDEVVTVTEDEAYAASRAMAEKEGILVGITSGAAMHVAKGLAKMPENNGKTIVVLLPDTGERYLSTKLFQ
jgi:cysteine synthase